MILRKKIKFGFALKQNCLIMWTYFIDFWADDYFSCCDPYNTLSPPTTPLPPQQQQHQPALPPLTSDLILYLTRLHHPSLSSSEGGGPHYFYTRQIIFD